MAQENYSIFTQRTAGEFIWGYSDPILSELHKYLPSLVPSGEFGFCQGYNESLSKVYEVYDGSDSFEKWSVIKSWNSQSKLSLWNSPEANGIIGTDGQGTKIHFIFLLLIFRLTSWYVKSFTCSGFRGCRLPFI